MNFKSFEIKTAGLAEGEFECFVSTFGPPPDSYGDIVAPGAFDDDLKARGTRRPLLWQHDPANSIGTLDLTVTERGLKARGRFLLDLQSARDAYIRAKAGLVKFSIGYETSPGGARLERDGTRTILALRLWEASCVTFPANERAVLTLIKDRGDVARSLTALASTIRNCHAAARNDVKRSPDHRDPVAACADRISARLSALRRQLS